MTSAALIVVVVAGSFAFADIVLIKALGLGMAIAVALDATVVRALLVPVDDAPARALELVDAGAGSSGSLGSRRRRWSRARRRRSSLPHARGGRPRRRGRARLAASARRLHGRRRSRQPAATPVGRTDRVAGRADRPSPIVVPARRRAPRPADRVVVLHRPPARRRRPPLRVRVRHLPRRARRVPGHLGVAPRADRRGRRALPCTTSAREIGPQVDRSPSRRGRLRPRDRGDLTDRACRAHGRRAWTMQGGGRTRLAAPGAASCRGRDAARPATLRSRPATARRRCTTTTAGSTSVRPAAPTTTRGRGWPRRATLDARRRGARTSTGRPGSTTSGATSSRSAAAAGTGSPSTSTTART